MKLTKEFREKCSHCEHAAPDVRCCFCSDYIYRSGNIIFRSSDKPIVIHDVNVEPTEQFRQEYLCDWGTSNE